VLCVKLEKIFFVYSVVYLKITFLCKNLMRHVT